MELWKPVPEYEGYYNASNYGNIYSVKNDIILKPFYNKEGYLMVDLCKNGVTSTKLVHRIIAETHLANPDNLPCVNHKDEVKDHNNVLNLEWCSYSYNNSYGTKTDRIRATKRERYKDADDRYHGYKIVAYDYKNNVVGYYRSISEASQELGINRTTISEAMRLRDGKTRNYLFRRTK